LKEVERLEGRARGRYWGIKFEGRKGGRREGKVKKTNKSWKNILVITFAPPRGAGY